MLEYWNQIFHYKATFWIPDSVFWRHFTVKISNHYLYLYLMFSHFSADCLWWMQLLLLLQQAEALQTVPVSAAEYIYKLPYVSTLQYLEISTLQYLDISTSKYLEISTFEYILYWIIIKSQSRPAENTTAEIRNLCPESPHPASLDCKPVMFYHHRKTKVMIQTFSLSSFCIRDGTITDPPWLQLWNVLTNIFWNQS